MSWHYAGTFFLRVTFGQFKLADGSYEAMGLFYTGLYYCGHYSL